MKKSEKLLKFLSTKKDEISSLLIMTHDYPDPDGLASAYGLKLLAEKGYGIKSKFVYSGIIGRTENKNMVETLGIPMEKFQASDISEECAVALVDTQPAFKNNSYPGERKACIVIDQHKSHVKPKAELSIIDIRCGATCVVIAEALLSKKIEIPTNLATAISYGIISETQNLYRGTTRRVIDTYLHILPMSNINALAQIQNPTRSKRYFKTLGSGIQNANICGKLISSHLGFVENPDLVSEIADFLLTYNGMEYSFSTGRYKGDLRMSLRSNRSDINAGEVLREVVGDMSKAGGHGGIAGGSLEVGVGESEETWQKLENKMFSNLTSSLNITTKNCENFRVEPKKETKKVKAKA